MDLKPTDLASPAEWQNIQTLFASVTGLTSVTFDAEGNPVSPPDFQNEFCRAFKSTEVGATWCRLSHRHMAEEAARNRAPYIGPCRAGLMKVVVPIIVDGEVIGFTGGCGAYDKSKGLNIDELIKAGAAAGLDENTVRQLAETIKGIDDEIINQEIELMNEKIRTLIMRRRVK